MGILDKMRSGGSGRNPLPKKRYGIDQAAELLRTLPTENMELVITVVKKTLESFNVDIGQIVEDAEDRLGKIQAEINGCQEEIKKLKSKVAEREKEITELKANYAETYTIKEHLEEVRDSSDDAEPPEYYKQNEKAKSAAALEKDESAAGPKKDESAAGPKKDESAAGPKKDEGGEDPPKSKSSFFKRKGQGKPPA